jgi:tetratricopeptide (TPR) repeat protein
MTDLLAVARELVELLPEEHPNHFIFLGTEADALLSLGLSGEAQAKYAGILETLERQARSNPDRADYQRNLSVAYERMGDLMRDAGEGEQARAYYQQSLEIRERLARKEPDRADYQRDLSVSCERMGDLMRDAGKGEQARVYYQRSLEIRERLARQEPDRADYQTDVVVSLHRMGDRASLQRALTILHRLNRERKLTADQQAWIPRLETALTNLTP